MRGFILRNCRHFHNQILDLNLKLRVVPGFMEPLVRKVLCSGSAQTEPKVLQRQCSLKSSLNSQDAVSLGFNGWRDTRDKRDGSP